MDNNSFLSRWSKRKLEEQHEAEVDPASPAEHSSGSETGAADVDSGTRTNELHSSDSILADGVDSQTGTEAEGDSAAKAVATEDSKAQESANEQPQSVAALLASEASQQVKKAALRKLFLSGEFSEVDRLNDYDHDYSKVKSLSTEVAQGLRDWLNKADDKPEDEPGSEAQTVHNESEVSRVESADTASGNDLVDDVEAVNVNRDVNINGMSGKEATALDGKLAASAQSETDPEYRVDNPDDGTKSTT
ncbi:DUF3306 domain-containing protein [Vibrio sp. CDRSL-10 TSBA]